MKQALKNSAKVMLNSAVLPLLNYIYQRISKTSVLDELERRTTRECADYIQDKMPNALQFVRKKDLLDHAITKMGESGLIAEFGVWKGSSINHLARRIKPNIVYGFDSFEGLREDWAGSDLKKGSFDLGGELPSVLPNVRLVKGWFDKTLPAFLQENAQAFSLIHIDCDTREAATAVFEQIGQRIRVGTILVFDEYFGYRGWRIGEFKAWQALVNARGISYEYLAFSAQSVSVRITDS
jgi:hypothetical protein